MLNYEFPPMGGGAGVATFNIAKELARSGHSVEVITSRLKRQAKKEMLEGFTVHRVFSLRKGIHDCGFRGALTYVFFALFVYLRLIAKNNYDVIHYFFSFPTGLLSLWPGIHPRIPYVVSLRGSDVPYYDVYNKPLQIMHRILRPLTRTIWRRAAAVVALSSSLRDTALRTAPSQSISIIPNGINPALFAPDKDKRYGAASLKLVSVARLIERKGIQHVFEALSTLNDKNITLTIVGSGNYESDLKQMCDQYSLNERVQFCGALLREELPALYNKSDVFILPSLAESFGIVFAEAMACGLPIIGTKEGGIPDLVKPENGILVKPGDVDGIKNAILAMQADTEMRKRMSAANRKMIVEHYQWSSVASSYLEVYRKALG
jgi:glycosyltransferase involved in cell wall biosynthesis